MLYVHYDKFGGLGLDSSCLVISVGIDSIRISFSAGFDQVMLSSQY